MRIMDGTSGVLAGVVRLADGVNDLVGRAVAWLALGTVVTCFATVYLRYALGMNFIWLQEVYVWQHALVIVLGAGYTMMTGGLIRVDIFYGQWSDATRAKVDIAMTMFFLFPFLVVFGWFAWGFFMNSFRADEGSLNPGGLSDLWLLKSSLLAMVALCALQGLAIIARGLLVLRGHKDFALAHVATAEQAA
jgi:TRAP-type mannitol/chloroaromatic compound transport system permease small subunit